MNSQPADSTNRELLTMYRFPTGLGIAKDLLQHATLASTDEAEAGTEDDTQNKKEESCLIRRIYRIDRTVAAADDMSKLRFIHHSLVKHVLGRFGIKASRIGQKRSGVDLIFARLNQVCRRY
jgi:hypothetical protein